MLSACQTEPEATSPEDLNEHLKTWAEERIGSGKAWLQAQHQELVGEEPSLLREIPQLEIKSNPRQIAGIAMATFPRTFIFEAHSKNKGKTWPIMMFTWKIEALGMPLIEEDREIYTTTGKKLNYTFHERSTYRVTLTGRTLANQFVSTTVMVVPGL